MTAAYCWTWMNLADVPELAPDQFYGDATNRYRSKDGKYYGVPGRALTLLLLR